MRLSNAYGTQPLRIGAASISARMGGAPHPLSFDGQPSVVIGPGQERLSDPLALATMTGRRCRSVSSCRGRRRSRRSIGTVARPTGSPLATRAGPSAARCQQHHRAPAPGRYRGRGQRQRAQRGGDRRLDHRWRHASLDQDQRWTDHLAGRLAPRGVAVVNAGISGNRLLSDSMGESALARFQRDALDQPGVASVIVLIGINDISWPGTAPGARPGQRWPNCRRAIAPWQNRPAGVVCG